MQGVDADLPILLQIQTGDEAALESLMERHQTALFYFALRYCGNDLAAREVVQEAFVRAYFKASTFKPRSTVKTWLFTIALNLCRDAGRRRASAPKFVSVDEPAAEGKPPLEVEDGRRTADESAEHAEALKNLRYAIDQLPEKLKVPLILCALEQRSQKEAAEILETTPKTIELRIYRAKKKLRGIMTKLSD